MSKGTILIVDDKKLLRDNLKTFLEEDGYAVAEIDTGERAIDFIRHHDVDMVLLDHILPGISGLKTLQLMKKLKPQQTIIGLTGEITVKVIEDYLDSGAYDILAKSAIFEKLLPLLESARTARDARLKPELDRYPKAAEELKSEGRWEEAAVYLKEAGIEEKFLGNKADAKKHFSGAIDCFHRSGRMQKAREVEFFLYESANE
ncbi:MAG: response regulator [Acidobacteria bacterium]|nr:response regulator [Acidobacteriota bacterium]